MFFFQEGKISDSLIEENIMYKQPCRDTGNKKEQFTYRVRKAKKRHQWTAKYFLKGKGSFIEKEIMYRQLRRDTGNKMNRSPIE